MKDERYKDFTKVELDNYIVASENVRAGISFNQNGLLNKIFLIDSEQNYWATRERVMFEVKRINQHALKEILELIEMRDQEIFKQVNQKLKQDAEIFELISN